MKFLKSDEKFYFLVRGPPKKWGFLVLAKKPEIYDKVERNGNREPSTTVT